ncbi:MAG: hypothetical protein GY719_35060 [bacterium]|nr:hypothetical protein [bacterium]
MSPTKWLRISYRVGATADGLVAISMFAQAALGSASSLNEYVPEIPYRYAMGLAGSLMLGWTILLLWADRRPVERRGVLPITCVVVLGLMTSGLVAARAGFLPVSSAVGMALFMAALIALFTYAYLASRRETSESGKAS